LTPLIDQSTGSADYNSQMANSKLVTNVVNLLTQNNIMSEVAKDTGLESGNAVRNYLTVTNEQDTELVTVSATTTDPKLSKKLAEDTVNVFIEEMQDKINVKNIEVVDKARLSYVPSGPNVKKNTAVGALLGFLLGVAYAVIRMLMDTRLKNKEEAEKYLGIPVFCELPDLDK
jgi:capsular polysaccharide biosynthesis protein